jgi:mannose-6-phosphate isomerase-like protein (cupin superfamily)
MHTDGHGHENEIVSAPVIPWSIAVTECYSERMIRIRILVLSCALLLPCATAASAQTTTAITPVSSREPRVGTQDSGLGTRTPAGGPVNYLPADKVNAAFAKGLPIVETGTYKVIGGRRDRDGQAEVHARDTDIMYVLEGTATLVTGGQVVGGKSTAADEIRGDAITGGDARPLAKGDVIIIPNGIPHLFKDVKAPFLYYVVKVTSPRP